MAAKPLSAGGKGIMKPRSGSIELTTRKRLSRKSPGPELRKPLRSIPPPSNVVGPETVKLFVINRRHRFFHYFVCAI